MAHTTIVAIGDSIVEGKAATNHRGWVAMLGKYLTTRRKAVRIFNRGLGGDDILGLRRRLTRDCIRYRPDLILVGIGVNDSRYRPSLGRHQTPLRRFEAVVRECLTRLAAETEAQIVVSGQIPVIDAMLNPYKKDKYYCRRYQRAYEKILFRCASDCHVPFLDNFARWTSRGEKFIADHSDDGLHPNNLGHEELAGYAYEFLRLHVM